MRRAPLTYVSPDDPWLYQQVVNLLERLSGRGRLSKRYRQLQAMELAPREVWRAALQLLEVNLHFHGYPRHDIPREGPLVIIANHPFGVVDGLIMGMLCAEQRDRFSILANAVLGGQDPRIEDYLLPIDFGETKAAARVNIRTRQIAVERLQAGEAIAIFPSGGVATAPRMFAPAAELPWKRFTAQLIQRSGATVLPVFFHGQNSPIFHLASKWSMNVLRMGMLLHEVRNKMGKDLHVSIGTPITAAELTAASRQQLIDELFERTFSLGSANPVPVSEDLTTLTDF